jgi:hypothetical protein
MNWLFPGFLLGASAIALPVLLHLLRRRPKRSFIFPTLRFLAVTQQQTERRHRIQRWIVLLLRCAALALLAAVFARPFFGVKGTGSHATVIVIDNSFSVQAKERWPALQKWAREQIGTPTPGDKIGLLLMSPRPTWVAPLNTDAATALTTLEKLAPDWEMARIEPALRLAAETLAATPADQRQLIFLGDHQRVSWAGFNFEKKLPPGVTAIFPKLPEPLVRQAALRPPTLTRTSEGFRASLLVQNFSGAHARTLRVFRDELPMPIHQRALSLAERESQSLQIDLPAGGNADVARFRFVLDDDDLPADDRAYAVWHATGDRGVLLDALPAGSTADFIGSALASTAELKPALQVSPLPNGPWPTSAVAVLRNDNSFSGESAARLTAFLRSGGAALIFVSGGPAQTSWLANTAAIKVHALKIDRTPLQVRDWSMDHPLVAALSTHSVNELLGWEFRHAWALPVDAVDPLALWSGNEVGAALGETTGGAGRMLLCGFSADRRDGEWPVREVFVPFIHRAVAHLLGAPTGGVVKPALVSESLALPADSGEWRSIDGPTAAEPAVNVQGSVTPRAPGIYEFSSGATKKLFAVNLTPEESDLTPWSEGAPWLELASAEKPKVVAQAPVDLGAVEAEQRSSLWWWLVAALALVVLAEVGVANRTTR